MMDDTFSLLCVDIYGTVDVIYSEYDLYIYIDWMM